MPKDLLSSHSLMESNVNTLICRISFLITYQQWLHHGLAESQLIWDGHGWVGRQAAGWVHVRSTGPLSSLHWKLLEAWSYHENSKSKRKTERHLWWLLRYRLGVGTQSYCHSGSHSFRQRKWHEIHGAKKYTPSMEVIGRVSICWTII